MSVGKATSFLTIWICAICATCHAQVAHTIRGFDFYYDPDTVYLQPGDSVKFQTQGIHDMVQTDSAFWAINQAISNGGFVTVISEDTTFAVDTTGIYYFVCSPHGFVGMRGVLVVEYPITTTVVETGRPGNSLTHFPDPATHQLSVKWTSELVAELQVFDQAGRVMVGVPVSGLNAYELSVREWRSGSYVLILKDHDGGILQHRKFIKD